MTTWSYFKVFEQTGSVKTFSEPDALNDLRRIRDITSDSEFKRICRSTVNILCKQAKLEINAKSETNSETNSETKTKSNPKSETKTKSHIKAHLIKFSPPTMVLVQDLHHIYPDAFQFFMYRDGLSIAQSLTKIIRVLPLVAMMFKIFDKLPWLLTYKLEPNLAKLVKGDTIFCAGCHFWALSMRRYLDIRNQVKYFLFWLEK